MVDKKIPEGPKAHDTEVDLLVVGSGTGMAAALGAVDRGLSALVIEKTDYVGGSTARSGGAFWIPPNQVLANEGARTEKEDIEAYIGSLVGGDAPQKRWQAFIDHGADAVSMLERMTPMEFFWAKGYSDYHPENPGGSAVGRSCECKPFNAAVLGEERGRLRPGVMDAPIPMPVTGADYKWMNLMVRTPVRAMPRIVKRATQGVGGLALRREYVAGGQALAAGMFAGLLQHGVPVWTRTSLTELIIEDGAVTGAKVTQDGQTVTVKARRGVVLAAGGYDHDMEMRRKYQSPILEKDVTLASDGNTGDGIKAGMNIGAGIALMEESWWFPAIEPLSEGEYPQVLLAERSLPGSFIVDRHGKRFINEAIDYMSFGQTVLKRAASGDPVGDMWLVFDQKYRDRYMFAGVLFPGLPIPKEWYDAGIAVRGDDAAEIGRKIGVPVDAFTQTFTDFQQAGYLGEDHEFGRGNSAYDRYYGDPTVAPNANLRPLEGKLYAVKVVLSDLGTCGGLTADEHGRVLAKDGSPIKGLYAQGNNAANVFGRTYPGAGATIGQGLVFGKIIADTAASADVA